MGGSPSRRPATRGWVAHLLLWLALFGMSLIAAAQDVLPVPALSARITDQTQTLSQDTLVQLDTKLRAFEARKGVHEFTAYADQFEALPSGRPEHKKRLSRYKFVETEYFQLDIKRAVLAEVEREVEREWTRRAAWLAEDD